MILHEKLTLSLSGTVLFSGLLTIAGGVAFTCFLANFRCACDSLVTSGSIKNKKEEKEINNLTYISFHFYILFFINRITKLIFHICT